MLRAAAALLPALLACAAALPLQESSGPLAETEQVCLPVGLRRAAGVLY